MASTAAQAGSPYRSGHGSPAGGSSSRGGALSSEAPASSRFTAEMRDRQARGKDPYETSDGGGGGSDSGSSVGGGGLGGGRRHRSSGREPHRVLEKRRTAAQVLGTPEMLIAASFRNGESIPATRLRYTRMLCNIEAPLPALHHQQPQSPQQGLDGGRKKPTTSTSSAARKENGRGGGGGASR
ncbi:hypothetical protein DL762_009864 [Monosporascus cannonballus]|uniref:Uncharacterized protein n=1 Tax=Monosporascus cannonballus TaxID=155416 RepID=A0ABY0GWM1_9PEZI|nr:hypothetical protein DL762_009864 [Monosporascus cannonballus]